MPSIRKDGRSNDHMREEFSPQRVTTNELVTTNVTSQKEQKELTEIRLAQARI